VARVGPAAPRVFRVAVAVRRFGVEARELDVFLLAVREEDVFFAAVFDFAVALDLASELLR
jgi:hypothetical protein